MKPNTDRKVSEQQQQHTRQGEEGWQGTHLDFSERLITEADGGRQKRQQNN